jgi:hypothetical protein
VRNLAPAPVTSDGRGAWGLMRWTTIPDAANPARVYLRRLRLIETPWFGVKLHKIVLSDDPRTRGLHDHPWSFVSFQITGGYRELVPGRNFEKPWYDGKPFPAPDPARGVSGSFYRWKLHRRVNVVRADDLHAVRLDDERPCWTLVVNGRRRRQWGFRFPGMGWVAHIDSPTTRARRSRT